jgi:hypothetical protein
MDQPRQLTPRAALVVGLVFVASGIFPMLAAFDIGPLRQEDISGPPWLGFVAGGVFTAAGAVKTRWTTGAWPRNEEFIARQKVKGLLGRFGWKPPPEVLK